MIPPTFTEETKKEFEEKLTHFEEHVLYEDSRGNSADDGVKRDFISSALSRTSEAYELGRAEREKVMVEAVKNMDKLEESARAEERARIMKVLEENFVIGIREGDAFKEYSVSDLHDKLSNK